MKKYRIEPDQKITLSSFSPSDVGDYKNKGKEEAKKETGKLLETLKTLQERLYAEGRHSLLIVLQGTDTAGKDGSIKSVMYGVNPMGCHIASFKAPSTQERAHDFLWRIHHEVPAKGMIGIFNRSHYEDVLVPRVHGEIDDDVVRERFRQINDFERLLANNGTRILKFFLHISKDEQKERLEDRIRHKEKHWKFNLGDLAERRLWPQYQKACSKLLSQTSTKHAPWYVVPANHKWYRNLVLATVIVKTLKDMDPQFPRPPKEINFKKLRIV